jgi:diguanylate cyclase
MRYRENQQQSAEILRLVLPLMARQEAAFHPLSYALWYEHTAGLNPALARVLDDRLAASSPLTDLDVRCLYDRYILARDADLSEQLQNELRGVLEDTAQSTRDAASHATEFERALTTQERQLRELADHGAVRTSIGELLACAQSMRVVNARLAEKLAESARALEALSDQLEQAASEALLDPLTGLKNRRGFDRAIAELHERGAGLAGAALVLADIDHFKAINDTHGHLLGDKVIRCVAHVLRSNIKGRDIAVRMGGEEFAVLLPDTSLDGAASLAERFRQLVAQGRIRRNDGEEFIGHITLSLGVASADEDDSLESLIERADTALYAAKRSGRNRVNVARTESD